ncbi:fumarylacetoacetate (FAA) hydrolase family domain-containing protein [Trichoderma breve]|uniref:Fumarylacetoacetase n=1 Tax=Trichoderma breve TaxID=2034170 RepID=A0A9W9B8V5_9HYPO|nr:fumarylacetoacetate (FAA) hydrolase family domain-containing protein [Trichoderma breve]KAJ4855451.1 fumarylacetoacetate (FAA) hydrolase family domain-containing protein [Trichoderma breve]
MSWLPLQPTSLFSLANIPFGIFSTPNNSTCRPGIAIGDYVLDPQSFANGGGFCASVDIQQHVAVFSAKTLNPFAILGRKFQRTVREYLQSILSIDTKNPEILRDNFVLRKDAIISLFDVQMHRPLDIGDYTDFYAGIHHASNVGKILRGPANALQPNYTHMPIAYHGRASSVVISGTAIRRPWGQIVPNLKAETKVPILGPSEKLDFELELGLFICQENTMGEPISISEAEKYVFGYVLINDWSARDLQSWEYVPLGPFGAKNFGTSISAWVVLADAIETTKGSGIQNSSQLLPYLSENSLNSIPQIELEVEITTAKGHSTTITRTNSKNLLWSWPQIIAHHTITGCNLRPGDLLGSGTISGAEPGPEGSMMEQTQNGKVPIQLDGGEERTVLLDGDTITLRGWAG